MPESLAADPQFRARFDREARVISSLSHPHICALFDVGHQESTAFLVMEYLDGESLADRLAAGPLEVNDALHIAIQIAAALDAAHRTGIVHRDLKPGNIMLVRRGGPSGPPDAKLLDFGLAKTAAPAVAAAGSMAPTTPPNMTAQGRFSGRSSTWRQNRSKVSKPTRGRHFFLWCRALRNAGGAASLRRK